MKNSLVELFMKLHYKLLKTCGLLRNLLCGHCVIYSLSYLMVNTSLVFFNASLFRFQCNIFQCEYWYCLAKYLI